MWFVFALITAVFWASGTVVLKKGLSNISVRSVYIANALAFIFLMMIYWLIVGGFEWNLLAFLLSMLPALGLIYVLTALSKAEAGLVTALSSISPIIVAWLAINFLGESLSMAQIFLMGLALLGLGIMVWPKNKRALENRGWIGWGLGFGLVSGTVNFLSKLGISQVNSLSFSLGTAFWLGLFALVWLGVARGLGDLKKIFQGKEGRNMRWGMLVFNAGGVSLFLAMELGQVSWVMPVATLNVPLVMILAAWWLKEKISFQQKIGAGVMIASIMAFSML